MNFTLEVLANTRMFFNKYLKSMSLKELNTIPKGFNNNIIWNIGHIVVTQQLLAYKLLARIRNSNKISNQYLSAVQRLTVS